MAEILSIAVIMKEAYIMTETLIAVTMLDELKPRLWKRIVLTLILAGTAYGLFEGLTLDSAVIVVGLLTAIYIWIDYFLKKSIYRKYQEGLIKMAAIKENREV